MDTKLSKSRNFTRLILHMISIFTAVLILFAAAGCKRQGLSGPRMLEMGDDINGMVVTTGTADATPLEYFCTFEVDEEITTSIDCQVPPVQKLEIGHMIGVSGRALQELDWSELVWQVYLDGYQLDLVSFGEDYDVAPEIMSSLSPIREVFKQRKTWDVMLINPTFGMHTLHCTAKTGSVVYSWVVNFMINSTVGPLDMVDRLPAKPSAGQGIWSEEEWMERWAMAWDN